jgi:RNA polymerase sigma factor (sigma-70 family)
MVENETIKKAAPMRGRAEVEALIKANIPLIHWVIRNYGPARLSETDRDELFAHCLLGLWYAAQWYDPCRGAFSSFAVPKIIGRISNFFTTKNRMKRKIDNEAISLSTPLNEGEDGGPTLEDILQDPRAEFESRIIARDEIERLLALLEPRERRIIESLGQGLTLDAVGGLEGGVSRERIRQLRNRAVKKIQMAVSR